MIRIFGSTDRNFASNGDIILKPLMATLKKVDNGDYYIDIQAGLEYADYLVEGNIIIADTPQGDQPFRVDSPTLTKNKISCKAWHVFFDSKRYLIADSYVVNMNGANALNHLNNATEPTSEFTTSSDVQTIDSYRCVRTSLYDAIMTVVERWGGHLVRDFFNIGLKKSIMQDQGIVIQYKKNLKEITVDENWDNVVTKILPVGKDGILLNGVNPSASIYMTSDVQYSIPYTKTVSFEQDINEEDFPDETSYKTALVDDLRKQAQAHLDIHCLPQVNYTLSAHMDRIIDIGERIEVKDSRLNVSIITEVISYEYDLILRRYESIEFGNFKRSLSGLIPSINKGVKNTVSGAVAPLTDDINTMSNDLTAVTQDVVFIGAEVLGKQDALVSGTNIKTINGQSILGSGDLSVGITDYDDLTDKPSINNVTLAGNKSLADLGIVIPAIQYGYTSIGAVTGGTYKDVNVTFDSPFADAPHVECTMVSSSTSPTMGSIECTPINITATGFTIRCFNDTTAQRSPGCNWIAIL